MRGDHDDLDLVEVWEELGDHHKRVDTVGYETGPTLWVRYGSKCSCGTSYPIVSITSGQMCAHTLARVEAHRELHHLKHLVQELLGGEDEPDR